MKTRVIIVRHAQARGNVDREFHGWTDSSITEIGRKQSEKAAESLRDVNIDILYSSSLKRTLETAKYIADMKNLPIIRTDQMKEINGGDWEGVKFADLPVRFPQSHHDWENAPHLVQMPNGESMVEFQQRLVGEVTRIIGHHPGKNICIVTHGTAIKALMCHFKGISLEGMHNIPWFDNTSITTVDYEEGNFTILSQGEDSHLGMELSTIRNQDWWEDYIKKLNERNSINGTDMVNEVNSTVESNVSQAGEAGDEHIPGDAEIPGEDRNGGISDG